MNATSWVLMARMRSLLMAVSVRRCQCLHWKQEARLASGQVRSSPHPWLIATSIGMVFLAVESAKQSFYKNSLTVVKDHTDRTGA